MPELSDSLIKGLEPPASGHKITYDSKLPGFGCRVTKAGARSFVLNYRHKGRERRLTIGGYPAWKVAKARDYAEQLRREVDMGRDPLAVRQAEREAPTVADLAVSYLAYAERRKRVRSLAEDKAMLNTIVIPALGKERVADVARSDVVKLFEEVSQRAPIRANRVLSLLRRLFNLAATEFGMRQGPNPTAGIERNHEARRDRYLDAEELGRLLKAVATHNNRQSANVIKLALLTGARRGELLGATWDQFKLSVGTWTKPASMTKQNKLHIVPLNGPALSLLMEMKEAADAENARREKDKLPPLVHLFPGYGDNDAQGDLKRTWASVCEAAEIGAAVPKIDRSGKPVLNKEGAPVMVWQSDLRFHDLRHSFASFLVSSGHNLPLIGQLLGHSNPQTTSRYAHLLMDPQRQATDRIGSIFTNASSAPASVEAMPRRRA